MKQKPIFVFALIAAVVFTTTAAFALTPDAQLKRAYDFYFEVATGDIRGHSDIHKFGENADVDSAASEDIWDGGGLWSEPTTTQIYTFTSTSTADASDSTGARTMEVFGLNGVGALTNETVSLSGTVIITAANSYQMIHRMIVRTAGISAANVGTITANANTDGTVTAQIAIGANQTQMAIYKIPAGSDGCIVSFYASIYKTDLTGAADIIIYAKPDGEVWQIKQNTGLVATAGSYQHDYKVPNCFSPLTLIRMNADVSADDTMISGGFDMVLHAN
jgi:hypothetical protein